MKMQASAHIKESTNEQLAIVIRWYDGPISMSGVIRSVYREEIDWRLADFAAKHGLSISIDSGPMGILLDTPKRIEA